MKKIFIFLLLTVSVKAQQTLTLTPTLLFTASQDTTIVFWCPKPATPCLLYLQSTSTVYCDQSSRLVGEHFETIPLAAGENIIASCSANITYNLFQSNGVTPISFTPETSTPSIYTLLNKRSGKADRAMAFLFEIATQAQYDSVIILLRNCLADYRYGDLGIIGFVNGTTTKWGDYSLTGFPKKSYFTLPRQTRLLQLLQ